VDVEGVESVNNGTLLMDDWLLRTGAEDGAANASMPSGKATL